MNKILLFASFLLAPAILYAQSGKWVSSVESQTVVASPNNLPFWFRANQNGSIPLNGTSESLIGAVNKLYDSTKTRGIDWSAGIKVRANAGNQAYLTLIEGYVKARKGVFEAIAGRFAYSSGIVDTTLSTGSFTMSGNALGIPKIGLYMPQYYVLPFFNKLFAFKASYEFGYIGNVPIQNDQRPLIKNDTAYYQHNSLQVRMTRPNWKVKIFGSLDHHVMYGDERRTVGADLTSLETFFYAATGKTYQGLTKVGNHIGSIDMALQYDFENTTLFIYRQNLIDEGALARFANLKDGINGISLTNKRYDYKNGWHKVLLELIYTKQQAGYFGSRFTKSGDENYYNNYAYQDGWTYNGLNLGNPLLASRRYTRAGLPADPVDFIIDNRVFALHAAGQATLKKINFLVKLTYSQNFGTFGTAEEGHSTGREYLPPLYGLFTQVDQFSGFIEASKNLKNGVTIGASATTDVGRLYYNSVGVILKVKKNFN